VPATPEAIAMAQAAAEAAADKLATDIVAIDVSQYLVITDVFLLCTAANDRQVRAVVDAIEERLALLDYGDIVIHVQIAEERIHYALERLWKDCPSIPLDVDTSR
jgi:ribosome-associated protein